MARGGRQGGATLVEVMLSVLFLGLFAVAVQQFARTLLRGVRVLEAASEAQEAARIGVQQLVADLREAGFSPTRALAGGLLLAERDAVRVARDLNGDGDTDDANELVGYRFAADRHALTRALGGAPPQPMLDGLAADGLEFRYFAAGGAPIPVGSGGLDAAQRAQVRRVAVRLTIEIPNPDPAETRPLRAEQHGTATLRNG